jgi:hypothetical protein
VVHGSRGGVSLAEVARGIAEALRRGYEPGARQLIVAGGELFDRGALAAEVSLQAREIELNALRAAQERWDDQVAEKYRARQSEEWE